LISLPLATAGCNTSNTTSDGREFCDSVRSGKSVVDIALADPIEHPPGVYESLVAEWVSNDCPEQAIENEDLRDVLTGWGFDPSEIADS
jgi:hypothetical protein